MLYRLYTCLLASMNRDKLDKHGYPLRLAQVSNERVIDIFVGWGPMKLHLIMPKLYRSNLNEGKNISCVIFTAIIIINSLLCLIFISLIINLLKNYWTKVVTSLAMNKENLKNVIASLDWLISFQGYILSKI